jgi:hypothetical protein
MSKNILMTQLCPCPSAVLALEAKSLVSLGKFSRKTLILILNFGQQNKLITFKDIVAPDCWLKVVWFRHRGTEKEPLTASYIRCIFNF